MKKTGGGGYIKIGVDLFKKDGAKMDSINNSHKAIIINEEICNGIFCSIKKK